MTVSSKIKAVLRSCVSRVGCLYASTQTPRVLCYHGICEEPCNDWSVSPIHFSQQMAELKKNYHSASLPLLIDEIKKGKEIEAHSVTVTFDDGFLDVFQHAFPLLQQQGIPGTVFIVTGCVDKGKKGASRYFHPDRPFMNWEQIRTLHQAGWTIGSHTVSHPKLSALSAEEARRELGESKDTLEQKLGAKVKFLAYPFGTPHTVSKRDQMLAVEVGYEAAFMNVSGPLLPTCDFAALPRNKILSSDSLAVFHASLMGRMDLWSYIERSH